MPFPFDIAAVEGRAGTGVLKTARGEIRTHAFMPVGTAATVKALTVDQFHWGHRCAKPTRLYVVGCSPADVPAMPHRAGTPTHCISQGHGVRIGHPLFKSRVPQWEREATPPAFAAWLAELARRCSKQNSPICVKTDAADATP
jgi:hypothetical protein